MMVRQTGIFGERTVTARVPPRLCKPRWSRCYSCLPVGLDSYTVHVAIS